MEEEKDGVISVREFLSTRCDLIRDDYFKRHKDVQAAVKTQLDLPDLAFAKLEDMCK